MWPAFGISTNVALGMAFAIARISAGELMASNSPTRTNVGNRMAGRSAETSGRAGHTALSGGDCGWRRLRNHTAKIVHQFGLRCQAHVAENNFGPIISATRSLPQAATFSAILSRPARASSESAMARVSHWIRQRSRSAYFAAELPGDVATHRKVRRVQTGSRMRRASSSSASSSAYCSIVMPRTGSTSPSGDWPKPRRSGAITRAVGASDCDLRDSTSCGRVESHGAIKIGGPAP